EVERVRGSVVVERLGALEAGVFVHLTVAVVVHAVGGGIVVRQLRARAACLIDTAHAARRRVRVKAIADAAGFRHVVLVHLTVAVVVDAVAGVVVGGGGARRTAVDDGAADAAARAGARAGALSTARGGGRVVFVDVAVAVVVDAVAGVVVGGGGARRTAVDD